MKTWIGVDRGLPREIENLLILVYAEQTNRAFVRFGGSHPAKLDDLPAEVDLRQQVLPTDEEWQKCKRTLADVFGYDLSRLLNASNLTALHDRIHKDGANLKKEEKGYSIQFKSDCDSLPGRLQLILRNLGVSEDDITSCDRVTLLSVSIKEKSEYKQQLLEYWTGFHCHLFETKSSIAGTTPLPQNWNNFPIGRSWFCLSVSISQTPKQVRVALFLEGPASKSFFEQLSTQKSEIEREMEQSLNWFSEDTHKQSRISISKPENFFSSPEKWIEDFFGYAKR